MARAHHKPGELNTLKHAAALSVQHPNTLPAPAHPLQARSPSGDFGLL